LHFLDLNTLTYLPTMVATAETSGSFTALPNRNLVVFTTRGRQGSASNLRIIDLKQAMNPTVYDFSDDLGILGDDMLGSVAADCSTGLLLASDVSTGRLFVADISRATFSPASTPNDSLSVWSAPVMLMGLSEPGRTIGGATSIAIESATHLAILGIGSGGNEFGAARLPQEVGHGPPDVQDWVVGLIPNAPDGSIWETAQYPEAVAAYVSPNTGRAVGLIVNEKRTLIATVDLEALLEAARTGDHALPASLDLVGNGIVGFVPVP
jgi:hypothetical protein